MCSDGFMANCVLELNDKGLWQCTRKGCDWVCPDHRKSPPRHKCPMAYEAVHRFARISARKVRPLADLIRGESYDHALAILRYQPQRGARMLEKLLESAFHNAEDRRAPNLKYLRVVEVRVDQGPMFGRMRPRARGMAAIIKKRTAHIQIVLE